MAAFPEATTRKMFGYLRTFVNGYMTTGLFADSMFVRLSPENEEELLRTQGARPFEPLPGRRMRGYVVVPEALLGSSRHLRTWIAKAIECSVSLAKKSKK